MHSDLILRESAQRKSYDSDLDSGARSANICFRFELRIARSANHMTSDLNFESAQRKSYDSDLTLRGARSAKHMFSRSELRMRGAQII